MIEIRQCEMRLPLPIHLDQEVAAPDAIARHRAWDTMFELSPSVQDLILLFAAGVRPIGFTHGHLPLVLPPPVEVMRNRPAARLRHERFEVNDFLLHPLRLRLGEDLTRWRIVSTMVPTMSCWSKYAVQPRQSTLDDVQTTEECPANTRQHERSFVCEGAPGPPKPSRRAYEVWLVSREKKKAYCVEPIM